VNGNAMLPADPVFVRSFKVLYNFERVVEYRVLVVDVDNGQDHANVPVEECVSEPAHGHWLLSRLAVSGLLGNKLSAFTLILMPLPGCRKPWAVQSSFSQRWWPHAPRQSPGSWAVRHPGRGHLWWVVKAHRVGHMHRHACQDECWAAQGQTRLPHVDCHPSLCCVCLPPC
jgi:hypothetical protein